MSPRVRRAGGTGLWSADALACHRRRGVHGRLADRLPVRLGVAHWFYALCLFPLVLVLVPGIGTEVYGSQRWIHLGVFSFQPSETAMVAVLLMTASLLVRSEIGTVRQSLGVLGKLALASGVSHLGYPTTGPEVRDCSPPDGVLHALCVAPLRPIFRRWRCRRRRRLRRRGLRPLRWARRDRRR